MYERVYNPQTQEFETIDFLPAFPNERDVFWSESDKDYLFDHMHDYIDHTKPKYSALDKTSAYSQNLIHFYDHTDASSNSRHYVPSSTPNFCDLPARLHRHGQFVPHLIRTFADVTKAKTQVEALQLIESANNRLIEHGYSYAMSDDEITDLGKRKAAEFLRVVSAYPKEDAFNRFQLINRCLESLGLSFRSEVVKKAIDNSELFSLVNRALDENWLIRQLRRKCALELESVARDLALVQKRKQVYCSDFSLKRQRDRRKSNEIALQKTVAYDELDPENWFTLHELSAKSVSNPEIRRCEMFVRLRGFEEIAQECEHASVFYTVTAPSRFHAVSKGATNQNWLDANKPTVKQTHDYLLTVWQNLRKWLDKNNIKVYGMRIVEPHQDGTPHHHMLLFMENSVRDMVTSEFNRLAMQDMPNEKGAKKYRFKSENIDFSKGSAVGYVAKYLSKNIDGQHIDSDRNSNLNGTDAADRVVTWARVNQIRQFQFIGGPSVTVWRELRRLREEFKEDDALFTDLNKDEHFLLEKVRRAADEGDWKAFCYAMGGVFVKRNDQSISASYSVPQTIEKLIESNGEFSPTRYGDAAQARLNGLLFKKIFICTRFRDWKIENKEQFLRAQSGIMTNVVDWFDALEKEREYEQMADELFDKYEARLAYLEDMAAMELQPVEIDDACWVGAAPPDTFH